MPDTHAAVQTIRSGAKGEPALLVSTTSNYDWLYNDWGSGASMDVSIFRPTPTDTTFWSIGDYAQGNYGEPTGTSIIVKAIDDDPQSPLIKAPSRYTLVWKDKGSWGKYDGSIWAPVAPDGYVTIGHVGQKGYDTPAPRYACIRYDLAQALASKDVTDLIWSDHMSRAPTDVSLWMLPGVPNAFVSQANYNPWHGTAYKLKAV